MKTLIVIDMQTDFIDGSLGTKEAQDIVPKVREKIEMHNGPVIATSDIHYPWYFETLEGEKLPIKHCMVATNGSAIEPDILTPICLSDDYEFITKDTFGTFFDNNSKYERWLNHCDEIEIVGLCTDICVISNALILRTKYPNKKITIDASCCAGSTTEKHKYALEVMKGCAIDVINE